MTVEYIIYRTQQRSTTPIRFCVEVADRLVNPKELFKLDFHPGKNMYDRAFVYLLVASAVLRLIWLDKPGLLNSGIP